MVWLTEFPWNQFTGFAVFAFRQVCLPICLNGTDQVESFQHLLVSKSNQWSLWCHDDSSVFMIDDNFLVVRAILNPRNSVFYDSTFILRLLITTKCLQGDFRLYIPLVVICWRMPSGWLATCLLIPRYKKNSYIVLQKFAYSFCQSYFYLSISWNHQP